MLAILVVMGTKYACKIIRNNDFLTTSRKVNYGDKMEVLIKMILRPGF